MLQEDYIKLKERELEDAKKSVDNIISDKRPAVKYKESRPITDIKHMIETSASLYEDHVAFYEKKSKSGPYEATTYKEMLEMVNGFGTALINLGLKNKKVAIIGANSSKWAVSYLGVVCGTGVAVPLDKELTDNSIENIIKQSETTAVICDKKFEQIFANLKAKEDNNLEIIINMNNPEDNEISLSWDKLIKKGKELQNEGDKRFTDAQIMINEMSILLYTSGTMGVSKGVMLSHKNIAEDLMAAPTVLKVYDTDIFFSVLPIHHTYECTCGFLMPLYKGAAIAYCEGLKYITKNLQEIKPTLFLGVPAIFELLYKKIWQNVRKQGKEKLLKSVIKVNNVTKKVGLDLGKIFYKDIIAVFGGRMRMMICGGAAINPEVLDGIRAFGINAVQGYGLTECAPLAALNPDTAPNSSSVGIEFPGISLSIMDKNEEGIGEICVKGPNVMLGYYNMPELTAEVIKDGWFHTGDMGYIDENGYTYITGRKKNVIITKNGENVFPEEIEYLLNLSPIVLESMVFAENNERKDDTKIAATIVVDNEGIEEIYGSDLTFEQIEAKINEVVDNYNDNSPAFRKIRKVIVRKDELLKNTSQKIIRFAEENKR